MKSGLPVTVMVTVWSHGLYIEDRLSVLRQSAIVKCWWRFEMLPKKLFSGAVVSTRSWLAVKTGPDTMLSSILF